jgi:hypothetical protein
MRRMLIGFSLGLLAACQQSVDMNSLADRYVQLVLAVGQHDPDFVDAYYGPPEWKTAAAEEGKRSLDELAADADALQRGVLSTPVPDDLMEGLRREYLVAQLGAVSTRLRMLSGERLSFDEEAKALYGAAAPMLTEEHFAGIIERLDPLVPGEGPLSARVDEFRSAFVIPPDKLDAVFRAAIEACRARTAAHLDLPAEEQFTLEYVTDKAWSGYNWYQGDLASLIQVNTDLPIHIDRAIDLACHEGYPGHHVYNMLLERDLVRGRGWREFSVYPLFSPQSLIAEGTANFGIEMAFPGDERLEFEQSSLFPLAGLDPSKAEQYYTVMSAVDALSYAGNEAARQYLNGDIDEAKARAWLQSYALMSPERARQRLRFIEQYRSYVINYNLGKDLVRRHVERLAGDDREARWRVFGALLSSPRLPGAL